MPKLRQIKLSIGGTSVKYVDVSLQQSVYNTHTVQILLDASQFSSIGNIVSADEFKNIIGEEIVLEFLDKKGGNTCFAFNGIAKDVSLDKTNGRFDRMVVDGVGISYLSDLDKSSSTYEDMNVDAIANKVFSDHDVRIETHNVESITLPYVTRYGESATDFIARLAMRYAMWFYFDGERYILGEYKVTKNIEVSRKINADAYNLRLNILPVLHRISQYDYIEDEIASYELSDLSEPTLDRFGKVAWSKGKELFRIRDSVYSGSYLDKDHLKQFAIGRYKNSAAQVSSLYGDSSDPNIHIGTAIDLKDTEDKSIGVFHVTEVSHQCDRQGNYTNTFSAIPADLEGAPPSPMVKVPRTIGAEVATVKENNDPEELGRVRVQFKWQEEGQMTPWIRCVFPYGGGGDMYFVPEIDDQVLVDFESNHPDKPYVLGSVYHGKNKPAFFDPDNKLKAINTKTGHQIVFDERDESGIQIITADSKNEIRIGFTDDGEITITTEGTMNLKSKTINIEGEEVNIKADQALNVEAGQDLSLKGANTKIEANQEASIKGTQTKVEGQAEVEVKGAQAKLSGDAMTTIKGGMVQIN